MKTLPVEVLSLIMAWLPATDVVRRGGSRASLGPLLTSSSRLYRVSHDSAFWEWVCTTRCPTVRCDAYSIDTFVRSFMSNSYRLLASGRVVALPEDAQLITAVIGSLTEPCHVTLFYITEKRIPNFFLCKCTSLISLDTSGLTAVEAIGDEFLYGCTLLSSLDTSGLTAVEAIGSYFLDGCTSLASLDSSGLTAVKAIGSFFLCKCTSLRSFDSSGLTAVEAIGSDFLYGCTSLPPFDSEQVKDAIYRQSKR